MLFNTPLYHPNPLRDVITNAKLMDETMCINMLIPHAQLSSATSQLIYTRAEQLVHDTRAYKKQQGAIDALLHQYDLSTEEGIALMCLAEALLRIPDTQTMDKFIADKLSTVDWRTHLGQSNSLFLNAATWSLLLSGKIYGPTINEQKTLSNTLSRAISRVGIPVIRPIILRMMKILGNQFVLGEDIKTALQNALPWQQKGYLFSYDMLGEAARTEQDAKNYFKTYQHAIETIGELAAKKGSLEKNPGISVKLSALHPRYEISQYERIQKELPPILLKLALLAKKYNITLVIDAEESDRLDLLLDIFEKTFSDPALKHWDGLGLAIQAYQKRTFFVIDWLVALAKQHHKRIFVRLIKGAYWDTEIKMAQVAGLENYPVFTRKHATDLCYVACAKKLFSVRDYIYPQFGTHNAHTIATIMEIAPKDTHFEMQCLRGMGEAIYDSIIKKDNSPPVRIYAPVGTHRDLLGYLVRRLLENGANTSFVNLLAHEETPLEKILQDPVSRIKNLNSKPHPHIPLPKDIYQHWQNSKGMDLSNANTLASLKAEMEKVTSEKWMAASIVNGTVTKPGAIKTVISPNDSHQTLGFIYEADELTLSEAIRGAQRATKSWGKTEVNERAQILEKAAELLEAAMPRFMTFLTREAGRSVVDSLSEVREAIDYCRYYAYRARIDMTSIKLPGPTGEENELALYPRGIILCISPWNFPLAIFLGQITAALVTGNCVIAKPAEQTPLVAFEAVQLLHRAGIPKEALQLVIGPGERVGHQLVKDPAIAGVIFTGSTETAKNIEKTLANRPGPIAMLIAETGGQNAMIVDSSTLLEQSVMDITQSAFNSVGQRCSALRVLFVQEEIANKLLHMLKGAIAELVVDNPTNLATDVGPVIDQDAYKKLKTHLAKMKQEDAKVIATAQLKNVSANYFAPCVIELKDLSLLKEEIFGPILHVIKYKTTELDDMLESLIKTGFGLTFGIQSRINTTYETISKRMPIGNIYVNRNMIGAVVGVHPFGGESLSGTGPKAGGPHYLPRLCVERSRSVNITAVGGNARLISLEDD